jgi:YidC/Oxa1 family membrane protein insertase
MLEFFHTTLFVPIYNLLIFLVDKIPGGDLGLAVVLATLIVKIATAPLSFSALKTQKSIKDIEPLMKDIREKYKDDREEQAKALFALYKEHGINPLAPLASILLLFIQIPILFALFFVFQSKLLTDGVDPSLLYSFVPVPEVISAQFLGLISIAGSSFILALLTAGAQFLQAWYAIPIVKAVKDASMMDEFARVTSIQARFVFPIIMAVVAFTSGAIALYFITSSFFAIFQEFWIRKFKLKPARS